jgi:MT0933-like antitoxin protein
MPSFGKFADKVKGLAGKHPDTVSKAVDKAEELADKKSGGQFGDQIKEAGQWVEGQLGTQEPGAETGKPTPAPQDVNSPTTAVNESEKRDGD